MVKLKRNIYILFALQIFVLNAFAQTSFYDINTIQKIEVVFTQTNWDYQLDTAKLGSGGYVMAQSVTANGTKFDSVGVKYKGSSSYDSTNTKNPFHFALDKYKGQSYQGFTDIKLSNDYSDPSMIREALSYQILKNYMDCPRANFAQLYINGAYMGLFTNDEDINKKFCGEHFYTSKNTFIKCNPLSNPGPNVKSNLKFITADSSVYSNFYEVKSKNGWNELIALCDTLTNHSANIDALMDMDRVIWMLAFNNVLINLDSYTGAFAQNYYLYKDKTARFNPIIWDMNMSFGGFPFVGSSNSSMGSLTVANMQQLPVSIHASDPYWPLINVVMANASYKKIYIAHMRTIVNEIFANSSYETMATSFQNLIDTAVKSDNNKFYSYTQFQDAMTANNTVGSYTVPGIKNLMDARINYLKATTDFQYTSPVIAAVSASTVTALYSSVKVTANIANASTVYLAFRFDSTQKFIKIPMYDDGAHNDGAAGDNIYGESFTMLSAQAQYYIYAENAQASIFSPERAEHEFYKLNITSGVNNISEQISAFGLYPSPASDLITLSFDELDKNKRFDIYNTFGQIIQSEYIKPTLYISTSNFANGIYFVKVGDGGMKKFVVQH